MPDRRVVFAKVRAALVSVLEDEAAEITPEQHLVDDLGFDSTSIATLTIALEDEFEEVLLLNDWIAAAHNPSELTVQSLVDYLHELLAETD
jgi:acyl carrier protein